MSNKKEKTPLTEADEFVDDWISRVFTKEIEIPDYDYNLPKNYEVEFSYKVNKNVDLERKNERKNATLKIDNVTVYMPFSDILLIEDFEKYFIEDSQRFYDILSELIHKNYFYLLDECRYIDPDEINVEIEGDINLIVNEILDDNIDDVDEVNMSYEFINEKIMEKLVKEVSLLRQSEDNVLKVYYWPDGNWTTKEDLEETMRSGYGDDFSELFVDLDSAGKIDFEDYIENQVCDAIEENDEKYLHRM